MTYDFKLAGTIQEPFSALAVNRAHERIHRARSAQFTAQSDAARRNATIAMTRALTALYEAQPNEFHLTSGSIVILQRAMLRLGMLDLDLQHDRWPRYADYGVTDEIITQYNETGDEPRELARFNAAADAVRDKQAENPTGIPLYKLKTNDMWLITPDEITAALGAYRTALGSNLEEPRLFWWPYWIEFLELAGKHLGARVH